MIISASYKTDLPAFYGEWFMRRLQAGYCQMRNAYSRQVSRVSLAREAVDGFVFWTKNVGPFLKHLDAEHSTKRHSVGVSHFQTFLVLRVPDRAKSQRSTAR